MKRSIKRIITDKMTETCLYLGAVTSVAGFAATMERDNRRCFFDYTFVQCILGDMIDVVGSLGHQRQPAIRAKDGGAVKLIKARVQNFRSVEDSGEFRVESATTCLVGKNESGKTALLTALYKTNPIFDGDRGFDRQRDYPRRFLSDFDERHPSGPVPAVVTWWELEPEEAVSVSQAFGRDSLREGLVQVIRGYGKSVEDSVPIDEAMVIQHLLSTSDLHEEEKTSTANTVTIAELRAKVASLEDSPRKTMLLTRMDEIAPGDSITKGFWKLVKLPKLMMYSQYQRMQGQVSLEQILERKANNALQPDDQVFLALCEMAATSIEKVAGIQQFEDLVTRFEGASNKISGEIFKYWSQNRFLKVQFRLDPAQPGDPAPFNSGKIFRTRVHNQLHQVTVPFDDRSTGFVWFFSFLALFSQVKKKHPGKLVLLLDEPGLSLHGKAQSDLLRYFSERLSPHHQVVYTTHSPFMVPSEDLLSVRTVEDVVRYHNDEPEDVLGTKVGDRVLSTDKDTLFPLQGALGYEVTQSLFVGEHTLLVEGPSDLLYLKAVSETLRERKREALDSRWTICPAGGVDKVAAFMSLFYGNRLHVAVLIDFAHGQKKKVEDLRRSDLLRDGHVFTADTYAEQAEADVEDILGSQFYVDLVNACLSLADPHKIPIPTNPGRVVKFVEEQVRLLPSPMGSAYNHYAPSSFLTERRNEFCLSTTGIEGALRRFETLFHDLNGLLAPK